MDMTESNICFRFPDKSATIKYDNMEFYRESFNDLPDAKGVDFLSISDNNILFMEVKNCKGHEAENRWRVGKNNSKTNTVSVHPDGDRDSVDIEMAKKVTMTLACLCGANTKPEYQERSDELKPYFKFFEGKAISRNEKTIKVVLFLEGNFSSQTRSEKMILHELGSSIEQKLSWLNCKVLVENSNTYKDGLYKVI